MSWPTKLFGPLASLFRRDETEAELRRLNWALSAYARSATALIHSGSLRDIYQRVCEAIIGDDIYVVSAVALVGQGADSRAVEIVASAGKGVAYVDGLKLSADANLPEGRGPTGRSIRSKSPIILYDINEDTMFALWRERARKFGIRSSVTVPINIAGDVVGVLIVYAGKPNAFAEKELKLFEALTDELAFAISFEKERLSHKQTEQGLLQAEAEKLRMAEKLSATLESVTDLVYSIDHSGYITYANGGTKRLFPQFQKLEGMYAWDITKPVEGVPLALAIERVKETKEPQTVTYFDSGFGKWFHTRIFLAEDGVTCYTRDLTEQKVTEERLMRSQRLEAVGQLAGGIAHDFNNLLTVITGNAEILGDLVGGDTRLERPLKGIHSAAQRAADLTMRILAFSRQQDLTPERVDLVELINEAEKMLSRLIGADIGVEVKTQPGLWPVEVDQAQFTNALINLCVNARDAMPTGGTICIEMENVLRGQVSTNNLSADFDGGDCVKISVIDTGTGIPAELLDKIVEPFFTTKDVGKGTGLGLSMVYGFAKQSGGDLKVRSELGKGTCVSIYLPRMSDAGSDEHTKASADDIPCGTERILLVEDDALVRDLVASSLRGLGYVVDEAPDAESALRFVQAGHHVDLLLSDIVMPGSMNGLKLAAEIQKIRPQLKTLFMSGFAENLLAKEGVSAGSIELLDKPFRRPQIALRVRSVLDAPPPVPHLT